MARAGLGCVIPSVVSAIRDRGHRTVRFLETSKSVCAALVLFAPSCGWAAADAKSCVLKTTAALPKVAGLRVKKSGVRPMPPEGPRGPTADGDSTAASAPAVLTAQHSSSGYSTDGRAPPCRCPWTRDDGRKLIPIPSSICAAAEPPHSDSHDARSALSIRRPGDTPMAVRAISPPL